MSGKIQTRLAIVGALAALTAVLIPAGLASGSHDGTPVVGSSSVVLLTMGRPDEVTWEGMTQPITTRRNDCLAVSFAASPSLLVVSPIGGQLGEVKDGIGVKGPGDGSGEPCGRVEADGEALSVALGSDLDGYLMTAVDVDLELKFNATVQVTYKHEGTTVATDTFTGTGASDDGPDSADGDNYRYAHGPLDSGGAQMYFDEVVFTAAAGAFSLEGGADGTENGSLAPNNSSQFEVAQVFDGEISCGDEVTIDDGLVPGVVGLVTMQALNLSSARWDALCTQLKNYNEEVTPTSLLFQPVLPDSVGRYTATITIDDQPITTDPDTGQITSLIMEYNDGSFNAENSALLPCETEPVFEDWFWEQADTGLLPSGEFACYFGVSATPTGLDLSGGVVGTEVWDVFFEDDPAFSFG